MWIVDLAVPLYSFTSGIFSDNKPFIVSSMMAICPGPEAGKQIIKQTKYLYRHPRALPLGCGCCYRMWHVGFAKYNFS